MVWRVVQKTALRVCLESLRDDDLRWVELPIDKNFNLEILEEGKWPAVNPSKRKEW